jgi:hypothetical protein
VRVFSFVYWEIARVLVVCCFLLLLFLLLCCRFFCTYTAFVYCICVCLMLEPVERRPPAVLNRSRARGFPIFYLVWYRFFRTTFVP